MLKKLAVLKANHCKGLKRDGEKNDNKIGKIPGNDVIWSPLSTSDGSIDLDASQMNTDDDADGNVIGIQMHFEDSNAQQPQE
uniref:Uncharacterized protein n=1 Tax=Ascaris lumbricoides TaxID=6252 RepID=A0A0M3HQ22_ASCLU